VAVSNGLKSLLTPAAQNHFETLQTTARLNVQINNPNGMNNGMRFDFMRSWAQNQDLNWGEMLEVAKTAEQAAADKAHEIRKRHVELMALIQQCKKECA
jgi:hypothetical protein